MNLLSVVSNFPFLPSMRSSDLASVQLSIIMAMEEMVSNLKKEGLSAPIKQVLPVPKDVQSLMEAGFMKHKKVRAFQEQQEALNIKYEVDLKLYLAQEEKQATLREALRVLLKARSKYGPDTLLLPLNQFMQICEKHNLVCGTFDQYTGDIPDDKLQEIKHLKALIPIREHNSGFRVTKITKTDSWSSSASEHNLFDKHFNKDFPIVRSCGGGPYVYRVEFLDGSSASFRYVGVEKIPSYYFIAAPRQMMREDIKEEHIPDRDPIIWGLAGDNVLIFTRWGEEAKDEVLQRYEAFNQKLDTFLLNY